MPDSKPTSMPPAEHHNSTGEIAWRIQENTKPATGEGVFFSFLNNSSLGQHKAGYRKETICIVTRPLGEMGAHVMLRVEEGTEELRALWVWGGGRRAEGGGVQREALSNHRPSTGEPRCC